MQNRRAGRPTNAELEARAVAAAPRAEAVTVERKSRRGGALDVGSQLKMGLPPSWYEPGGVIDSKEWVSRWVNDDGNNVWMLQHRDDYDFVPLPEGQSAADLGLVVDSRSDSTRISMPVGRREGGGELRAYLMRKPLDFWNQHQAEILEITKRQELGRLSGADVSADGGIDAQHAYAPAGNSLRRTQVASVDYQP